MEVPPRQKLLRQKKWKHKEIHIMCTDPKRTKEFYGIVLRLVLAKALGNTMDNDRPDPNRLLGMRVAMKELEKKIGSEKFARLLPEARGIAHTVADRLFNTICSHTLDQKDKDVRAVSEKLSVEALELSNNLMFDFTGGKDGKSRWDNQIFHAKRNIENMTAHGLNGIQASEIRYACDSFIHDMVDHICDELGFAK